MVTFSFYNISVSIVFRLYKALLLDSYQTLNVKTHELKFLEENVFCAIIPHALTFQKCYSKLYVNLGSTHHLRFYVMCDCVFIKFGIINYPYEHNLLLIILFLLIMRL